MQGHGVNPVWTRAFLERELVDKTAATCNNAILDYM